jgi:hypothetical protein
MLGRWTVAVAVAAVLVCSGCVFDSDDRCGPGQTYDEDDEICRCDAGSVIADDGDGCMPCGEHEVVNNGACVCDDGYARATDSGPCEMVAAGLGEACDSDASTPCADDDFSFCFAPDGGDEGYCTRADCEGDDDCPSGYACDEADGQPFCSAPPTGQGTACEAAEDCEDFEASYCEALFINACLVEGCADSGEPCHGDYVCCDYSDLVGISVCAPPEQLDGDNCPFGGVRVEAEP